MAQLHPIAGKLLAFAKMVWAYLRSEQFQLMAPTLIVILNIQRIRLLAGSLFEGTLLYELLAGTFMVLLVIVVVVQFLQVILKWFYPRVLLKYPVLLAVMPLALAYSSVEMLRPLARSAGYSANGKFGCKSITGRVLLPPISDKSVRCIPISDGQIEPIQVNGKWGFFNSSFDVVIPPQFDETKDSHFGGLTPVRKGALWGYIAKSGEVKIPFQFEDADNFRFVSPTTARVKKGGKYGLIDRQGQVIVDYIFDEAQYLYLSGSDDLMEVRVGDRWGIVNGSGSIWLHHLSTFLHRRCTTSITKKLKIELSC